MMDPVTLEVKPNTRHGLGDPTGGFGLPAGPAGGSVAARARVATVEEVARPAALPAAVTATAGFWVRAVAIAGDYVLVLALQAAVGFVVGLGAALTGVRLTPNDIESLSVALGITTLVGYFTVCTGTWGRTPGKKLLDLEVVGTDGRRITTARAFCRTIAYAVSSLFWGLGFVWAGFDARNQAWHDKVCGTLVVHAAARREP